MFERGGDLVLLRRFASLGFSAFLPPRHTLESCNRVPYLLCHEGCGTSRFHLFPPPKPNFSPWALWYLLSTLHHVFAVRSRRHELYNTTADLCTLIRITRTPASASLLFGAGARGWRGACASASPGARQACRTRYPGADRCSRRVPDCAPAP